MNIYQISQELQDIFNEIEDNDGELTPELESKLILTQDNLKQKIKSYAEAVKLLQTDLSLIKDEKNRLNDLQKRKEATIERLQSVMAEAISQFGDTSKTGGKFVDYGVGKVLLRNTEVVEVDDDLLNVFTNHYIKGLRWYDMQGQLDNRIISTNDLCNYANDTNPKEEEDGITCINFTTDDLRNIKADINIPSVLLGDLLDTTEGLNLVKALFRKGGFEIKAKADKTNIKKEAKELNTIPTFAKLTNKQSVTIK